jgi:hypothetical protein
MDCELVWLFQRIPEEDKNLVRFQDSPPKVNQTIAEQSEESRGTNKSLPGNNRHIFR